MNFLFLDRDGVINTRLPGRYVQEVNEFQFTDGCLEAISILRKHFDRIVVVTNQQGIGKGIMTETDLKKVHDYMLEAFRNNKTEMDGVYFCPELSAENPYCRKPNPGMAFQAKKDFPEIDFSKSIMVGDSISDMAFGKRLGMKTIMIESNPDEVKKKTLLLVDQSYSSLADFSKTFDQP